MSYGAAREDTCANCGGLVMFGGEGWSANGWIHPYGGGRTGVDVCAWLSGAERVAFPLSEADADWFARRSLVAAEMVEAYGTGPPGQGRLL